MNDLPFDVMDIIKKISAFTEDKDVAERESRQDFGEQVAWDSYILQWMQINVDRYAAMMDSVKDEDVETPDVQRMMCRILSESGAFAAGVLNVRRMVFGYAPLPSPAEIAEAQKKLRVP